MPINLAIISGHRAPRRNHTLFLTVGDQVTLRRDLTTTPPDVRACPKGSIGWVRKFYGNGVILHMADGKRIPASFDFLDIPRPSTQPETPRMPRPYESVL
ncbi:MAG TPA: hypothetical protein VJJ55_01765 [Candidatus Paceibacterota bacterium]